MQLRSYDALRAEDAYRRERLASAFRAGTSRGLSLPRRRRLGFPAQRRAGWLRLA